MTSAGASEWGEYEGVERDGGYVRQVHPQQQQQGKRPLPEGMVAANGAGYGAKKVKGLMGRGGGECLVERGGALVKVSGSERGWEDEEAF